MKCEEIKKLTEEAVTNLITALEQGQSESLKKYLATMARFHTYSWGYCESPKASLRDAVPGHLP